MSFVPQSSGKGQGEREKERETSVSCYSSKRCWLHSLGQQRVQARLDGRRAYARPTHQEHLLSALDKAPPSTQQKMLIRSSSLSLHDETVDRREEKQVDDFFVCVCVR